MTNAINTSVITEEKKPKYRITAAEKREKAAAEYSLQVEEFEKNRLANWSELWINALRLKLMLQDMPDDFKSGNNWWLEDFSVNANEEYFQECSTGSKKITRESISLLNFDAIKSEFYSMFERMTDYYAEQERLRLEEQERQLKRSNALAKLTKEEKEILGL